MYSVKQVCLFVILSMSFVVDTGKPKILRNRKNVLSSWESLYYAQKIRKVYGGRVAQPNEYPYMAALYKRTKNGVVFAFSCGAFIYNKNYIVTAGHCIHIRVYLHEISTDLLPISKTFLHNAYDTSRVYVVQNDISMLQLEKPLTYSNKIKKLRIGLPNELPIDGLAEVIGWGRTEVFLPDGSVVAPSLPPLQTLVPLKSASVRILPRQLCTARHFAIFPTTILCVGGKGLLDSEGACFGDSGGPLICSGPSGPYLCGLVSTGVGCGIRFTPAFYTDAGSHYSWMRAIGGSQP